MMLAGIPVEASCLVQVYESLQYASENKLDVWTGPILQLVLALLKRDAAQPLAETGRKNFSHSLCKLRACVNRLW